MKSFRKWRFRFERRPSVTVSRPAGTKHPTAKRPILLVGSAGTPRGDGCSGFTPVDPPRASSLGELVSKINDRCFGHTFGCQHRLTQHHLGLPVAGNFFRSDLPFRDRETSKLTHEP